MMMDVLENHWKLTRNLLIIRHMVQEVGLFYYASAVF